MGNVLNIVNFNYQMLLDVVHSTVDYHIKNTGAVPFRGAKLRSLTVSLAIK